MSKEPIRSLEEPETIRIDIMKEGAVRLQCRWDIQTEQIEGDDPHTEYVYREKVLWWAMTNPTHVQIVDGRQVITDVGRAYIAEHAGEILNYAMTAGA